MSRSAIVTVDPIRTTRQKTAKFSKVSRSFVVIAGASPVARVTKWGLDCMKGIIFNVVEEVVHDRYGPDAWDAMLAATGLDGAYTSLGSYPDEELTALVGAACAMTQATAPEILRALGTGAMPRLHERYPVFFEAAPDARAFILSLNSIIHPEVRKLYSGAGCPHFHFADQDGVLTMGYNSPRKLCHLAHGFIDGLAAIFGETILVEQPRCMHEGDASCQLRLTWQ